MDSDHEPKGADSVDVDRRAVHGRAKSGIKLLMSRQVVVQILTFLGGVVLARVLTPSEFGLYAIATFLVATFALFGDFGLAPSLIQRNAELTERDIQVGFTLQQIITTVIVGVLCLGAAPLARLYPKAPVETVWLVRALAFSLYLAAWRSTSALQLERQLQYRRLAWIELVESLSYQAIAVGLALAGFGVWSFVWATLVRGTLGATLVYLAAPWPIRFAMDRKTATSILKFGIPFQLQIIVNQSAGWLTPLLVGSWIGPQAVGFLTWASSNGKKPLILVDNIMRVAFPHFSRIQSDREEVERLLTQYLTYMLLASGFWFALLLVAGPSLVAWVYTAKWTPAAPALILFASNLGFDVLLWMVGVSVNGLGNVSATTRVILLRGLLSIGITVPLVRLMGFNAVPVGALLASAASIPFIFKGLGKGSARRVLLPTGWIVAPLLASLVVGELVHWIGFAPAIDGVLTSLAVACIYAMVTWFRAPLWFAERLRLRPAPAVNA